MKNLFRSTNFEKYYKDLIPYFKKEKNQQYITLILTLSASIFFFIFAINPTLSTIANLKRQVSDAKFVEEKLSQKINNLSSLSLEYQTIKNDIPFILEAVPKNPEAPTLVAQIQALAEQSSIEVAKIEILPVDLNDRNATNSSSFFFELTGSSSFENIQKFLSSLTNMQRVISVDSIQISRIIQEGQGLELAVKGSAYFKK